MYARVVRFEGADADTLRGFANMVNQASGPPEGVPGVGFTLLIDADKGTAIGVGLFETEEDLQTGDQTLRQMDSPFAGMPQPSSIEMYEVAADRRA
jgi:hypothetical protein